MKYTPETTAPADAEMRKSAAPVVCYGPETLPRVPMRFIAKRGITMEKTDTVIILPREAR